MFSNCIIKKNNLTLSGVFWGGGSNSKITETFFQVYNSSLTAAAVVDLDRLPPVGIVHDYRLLQ